MQSLYKTALENFAHSTKHTATIWVSDNNRYSYQTSDLKFSGHCAKEPNRRKFRRNLSLEAWNLTSKGYLVKIQHTTIEG
jgi:hypothetical protein